MNKRQFLPRGAVMADVAAYVLSEEEKQRLSHPAIGGVILFRRNFQSVDQLKALTAEIKALREPALLIAVDHEGGRVQRFIDGFTRLPAMNVLGELWDEQGEIDACARAEEIAWVLATELRACGVDLSFTPVLDLNWGRCAVIGNRSLHAQASVVSALALALQKGLHRGGMRACGKHFPGHGFVKGDSHHVLPCDERDFETLWHADIQPFQALSQEGMAAIMPAHVIYPQVDDQPAGFSSFWLKTILRHKMGFDGVIFSDDLTMEGACGVGGIVERARLSWEAGCDIVLVCNRPDLLDELLAAPVPPPPSHLAEQWARMQGKGNQEDYQAWIQTSEFQEAQKRVERWSSPRDVLHGVRVGEAF